MSLAFYNSDSLFHNFNRLFNEAFDARTGVGRPPNNNDQSQSQETALRPRMDVHESKERNEVTITLELPGMKKEDVSVDVRSNYLTVSGHSSLSNDLEKDGYSLRERRYGSFSRSIPLPRGIKNEDIKASMEDGILAIKFPRNTPEQTPSKITIN